jgi:hypothetical protein
MTNFQIGIAILAIGGSIGIRILLYGLYSMLKTYEYESKWKR